MMERSSMGVKINPDFRNFSLALFLLMVFAVSGACLAADAATGPAFSSFEHSFGPRFSIPDEQKVVSLTDLYSFVEEFFADRFLQTRDGRFLDFRRSVLQCRLAGGPPVTVSWRDSAFSIATGGGVIEAGDSGDPADAEFAAQAALFLRLLSRHLDETGTSEGEADRTLVSGSVTLSGRAIETAAFSYGDGTHRSYSDPDPGYPFTDPYASAAGKGRGNLLGYLVGSTTGASYATVVSHGSKLDYISPAWFWLDLDRPGLFKKDPNFGQFSDSQVREIVSKAHGMGIKVLCLFHNLTNDPAPSKDMLHRILSEPDLREKCIGDIVAKIDAYGFDGVNMDFEFIHLADRDGYSDFMGRLRDRLRPLGKLTTVAVPAKFSDTTNSWNGQFDYQRLGENSDFVMVMTYNENGKWSDPGPVASLPWVEKAMKYSVSRIPPGKVMMGFPTYGYDWTQGGTCRSLSCLKAESLLREHGAELKWHSYYGSPYFEYTDSGNKRHTVWFENNESLGLKFSLIGKYGLNGAGMWRLGMETGDFWKMMKE